MTTCSIRDLSFRIDSSRTRPSSVLKSGWGDSLTAPSRFKYMIEPECKSVKMMGATGVNGKGSHGMYHTCRYSSMTRVLSPTSIAVWTCPSPTEGRLGRGGRPSNAGEGVFCVGLDTSVGLATGCTGASAPCRQPIVINSRSSRNRQAAAVTRVVVMVTAPW